MGLIWESEETIQLRKVFRIRIKLQKLLLSNDIVDDNALSKANVLFTELESLNINFFILMESKIGKILHIISRLNIPEYDINKRAEALLNKWKNYIPTPVAVSLYEAAVTASEQTPQERINPFYSNFLQENFNNDISNIANNIDSNEFPVNINGRRRRRRNIYINDNFNDIARMLYNNTNNINFNPLLRDEPFDEESLTILGNGGRRIRRTTNTNYNNRLNNLFSRSSVPSVSLLPYSNRPLTTSPLPYNVESSFEPSSQESLNSYNNNNHSHNHNHSHSHNHNNTRETNINRGSNLVRRNSIRAGNNTYNIRRSSRHAIFNHDGITYNDAPHISNTFHNIIEEPSSVDSSNEDRTRQYALLNDSPNDNVTSNLIYSSTRTNPAIVINADDSNPSNNNNNRYSLTSLNNNSTSNLLSGNIMASPIPDTVTPSFDSSYENNNRSNSGNHLDVSRNNEINNTDDSHNDESMHIKPSYNNLSEVSAYDLSLLIR